MKRTTLSLALLAALAACGDGEPLFDDEVEETEVVDENGVTEEVAPEDVTEPEDILNASTVSRELTQEQIDRGDIARVEAPNENGGGTTSTFSFDSETDTFFVDGLAFDGPNEYDRFALRSEIGGAGVFLADATVPDSLTGQTVNQIVPYFAIFDQSEILLEDGTPRTSVSIVRTGGFNDFGFGTFGYDRAGDFVPQTTGQATLNGDYAGARILDTFDELLLTSGQIEINIDFEDFDGTPGVAGTLFDRQAFDSVTGEAIAVSNENDARLADTGDLLLPDVTFVIRADGTTISDSGEIGGNVTNTIINLDGVIVEDYESGEYLGILAGDFTDVNDGGEIAGVLIFESPDIRFTGVTSQETGAFIATR